MVPPITSIITEGAVGNASRTSGYNLYYYAERMTGFFVPPYNATYTFYLGGDDYSVRTFLSCMCAFTHYPLTAVLLVNLPGFVPLQRLFSSKHEADWCGARLELLL